MRARGWILFLSCALAGGCSGAGAGEGPAPTPTPSPRASASPPAPAAVTGGTAPADLASAPLASGTWFQREGGALFGPPGEDPIFLIECDRDNRVIYIDRDGKLAQPGTLTVTAGGVTRSYPVPPSLDDDLPTVEATVPIDDPMLNTLMGASGRIAVRIDRQPWLVMPVHPAIAATIKACRSGN